MAKKQKKKELPLVAAPVSPAPTEVTPTGDNAISGSGLRYERNPKHKDPWQPGRKGVLCPDWSHKEVAGMLAGSLLSPNGRQRYATIKGVAFRGHEHLPGVWHGYPIGWDAVPPKIKNQWIREDKVTLRQINTALAKSLQADDE